MPSLKIKRGTRSQVTTAGSASGLAAGELYLVTDESRVDVGTSATASTALAKKSEVDAKQDTITATGILKGAGAGSISAATAGTDYLAPPSGTSILKANSGGALANAVAGTDYASPSQTFYIGTTQVAINRASAALTLAGITLTAPTLTGTKETRVAMSANDIDLSSGNYFTKTFTATTFTLTASNVPASGTSTNFILDATNGGLATIAFGTGFTSVKWVGGAQPTLTSSGRDVLGFFTHDGGATWTGLLLGKDVK